LTNGFRTFIFSAVKLSESRLSFWPISTSDIRFLPTFACYTERELITVERTKKTLIRCPLSSYFPFFVPCTQFQVSLPQFPISFPHPLFLGPLSTATLSLILCFPSSVPFSQYPSYSALSPIFLISPFLISLPSSFPLIVSIHHPFFPVSVDFLSFPLFAISLSPVFCPPFSVSWKKS
jgi:hypothetical protein